jgi:KUP system potassium uptake protein
MAGTIVDTGTGPGHPAPASAAEQPDEQGHGHSTTRWGAFALSLGALGVVYGDIGTSPLYTVQLIFGGSSTLAPNANHVFGAISLIFWSLMTVVTLKYVLLILRADNHGEGGIMALVAIIERLVTTRRKTALVLIGILGASLFYGDGMLTPAISVVSAVSGLNVASPALAAQVVPLSVGVLIALFTLQRFGTTAVGALFGPVMAVWFLTIGALGLAEVASYPSIVKALSPSYGAAFLAGDPKAGFIALGSVFLAVTGAEAIYADMGHFGRKAITRAWLALCLPTLVLNYLGQGALVLHRPSTVGNPFYYLVPTWFQLPMVLLATVATVIASQAVISGAFSVTQQIVQLGFLPRVSIKHTSQKIMGQIYIPVVNWALMTAVVALVLFFRSPDGLANAYGIALSAIFATNTLLAFVVFRKLWRKPLWMVIPGGLFFVTVELTFFAANLPKVMSGGWIPLLVGAVFFSIFTTWRRGVRILNAALHEGRTTVRLFLNALIDLRPPRVRGTAVYLTQSLDVAPGTLIDNAERNNLLHERVVLLTFETVGVPHVDPSRRVEIQPMRLGFVGVKARYGYQDDPDAVDALTLAQARGLDADVDHALYYLGHVSLLPSGRTRFAGWRKRLFILLSRNATPPARYYGIPPERVVEIGSYVQL